MPETVKSKVDTYFNNAVKVIVVLSPFLLWAAKNWLAVEISAAMDIHHSAVASTYLSKDEAKYLYVDEAGYTNFKQRSNNHEQTESKHFLKSEVVSEDRFQAYNLAIQQQFKFTNETMIRVEKKLEALDAKIDTMKR